jgi:outer membrane protein
LLIKKKIISKEAFEKEVIAFRKNVDQFKIEQQQIIKDFNNYKKKEIDKVFQTISPIINSYMEQKSVKILFDAKNIFMARNDLNLTNDILEAINKETK